MIETNKHPGYYLVCYCMIILPGQGETCIDSAHSAQLQTQQRGDETRLIMTDRHQGHSALPYRPTPAISFTKTGPVCSGNSPLWGRELLSLRRISDFSVWIKSRLMHAAWREGKSILCQTLSCYPLSTETGGGYLHLQTVMKTFSLHYNDSLMFGCILSSQDSDSLM